MSIPKSQTRLYHIYHGMKQRCCNPNCGTYNRYGGRGIKICAQWLGPSGFENFQFWAYSTGDLEQKIPRRSYYKLGSAALPSYSQILTIDRIDNDGDYCPENCRWIPFVDNASKAQREKYCRNHGRL